QEEYWSIEALLRHEASGFHAKLITIDGRKIALGNQTAASDIVARLRDKAFAVSDIVKQEKSRKPYPPFITSTLQQEAARKLSFSAAKTMLIAQQLYEGLELGELGSMGLITYMRTDSTRIAEDALREARTMITEQFGPKYLPEAARIYGKNKNAQDAHEAIRPSQVQMDFEPSRVQTFLTRDQFRLYELIWKRFLASQMTDAQYDALRVDIGVDKCVFRATGSTITFNGFLVLYDESSEEQTDKNNEENERIPVLARGNPLQCEELTPQQHFTQPPPRYSEATLVRELEEKAIGRPSTYAQIIDTLKKRKYVTVDARRFSPTEIGFMVKDIIVKQFPDIFSVGFTASMELSLDKIEAGEQDWVAVLKEFYGPFARELEAATGHIKELRAGNQQVTDRVCPVCKKFPLVIKWSRNGRFYACQGFPACKHTEPLEKSVPQPSDERCDKCGAPMVILTVNDGRFLGCSTYPACKNTRSLSVGVACPRPECGGSLVERRTRKGKLFFGCNKYPKCNFAVWDKPVNKKCEACNSPIMVYKETKTKGAYYSCPTCRAEVAIQQSEAVSEDAKPELAA
ncbi:MAG: type I DNA topoisomerase, partial [Chitinivibrionales bacterium]|nr:type I DNA topoisomerase [Chitinivibrionales bacterium]